MDTQREILELCWITSRKQFDYVLQVDEHRTAERMHRLAKRERDRL